MTEKIVVPIYIIQFGKWIVTEVCILSFQFLDTTSLASKSSYPLSAITLSHVHCKNFLSLLPFPPSLLTKYTCFINDAASLVFFVSSSRVACSLQISPISASTGYELPAVHGMSVNAITSTHTESWRSQSQVRWLSRYSLVVSISECKQ